MAKNAENICCDLCTDSLSQDFSRFCHFFGQSSGLLHSMMFKIFSFTLQVATL